MSALEERFHCFIIETNERTNEQTDKNKNTREREREREREERERERERERRPEINDANFLATVQAREALF